MRRSIIMHMGAFGALFCTTAPLDEEMAHVTYCTAHVMGLQIAAN